MKKYFTTFSFLIISLIFTLFNSANFFFWDSISQVSVPANWYFDNNFKTFFLPDDIATGHPTFAGMYIALLWKIFGRSLFVSHLALFPFIFGILFQLNKYFESAGLQKRMSLLILLAVVADATLLSQMSMISIDIIQIFFFLWCINSIINKNNYSIVFAFTGLCLISLRGAICAGGVMLFDLVFSYVNERKISIKSILPYLPGIISILIFLLRFYLEKHWIIHNTISNQWRNSSEIASFYEILRNIGILGWRLIDFGRVGLWVVFAYLILKCIKQKSFYDSYFKNTILIAVTQLFVFFPFLVLYKNFIGHRYLLPVTIPVAICTVYWVIRYAKRPAFLYIFILTLSLSGYFWIYPKQIAQGWDATPAHWPYYEIRREMVTWMKKESIPIDKTGSFFPNLKSFRLIDLSLEDQSFKEASIHQDSYILYSNVFNLTDQEIASLFLDNHWKEIKKIESHNVVMILFKKTP